jgi:hypothetical protein
MTLSKVDIPASILSYCKLIFCLGQHVNTATKTNTVAPFINFTLVRSNRIDFKLI